MRYVDNNRSICLARKLVRPPNRRFPIELLREEANVMERLDHEHIVKLIGTYCLRSNLYLLLWPVAVCNLDCLLTDLDCLKKGQGDREDIVSRLHALDLRDLGAIERTLSAAQPPANPGNCPLKYLKQIMGCLVRAVAHCHQENIRHLDLKPTNILLNPGRVYLADFGIARDVHNRDHTMTRGQAGTPKWRAPELHQNQTDWSMKAADVYSLGMVLLSMATVVYGAPLDDFEVVLGDLSPSGRAEKLRVYLDNLERIALATQEVDDVDAPTFSPKHIVRLVSRMVSSTPSDRPVIFQVDTELVELGGIDQVYHSPCCKRSSRFVTDRMNARFKLVADERARLQAQFGEIESRFKDMKDRLDVLQAKDETYESRIVNERKAQAENIIKLQIQLERERAHRKLLEARVAELERENGLHLQKHFVNYMVKDKPQKVETPLAEVKQQNKPRARPGIPRLASDRDRPILSGSPAPAGPMFGTRPPTQRRSDVSQPVARVADRSSIPPAAQSPRAIASRPAAAAVASQGLATAATRRGSFTRNSPLIPSTAVPPAGSSSPDIAGYQLRPRTSTSRLPLAVNPATPIRSNTPISNRNPSSADSTQGSMSSSIFSRLSLSRSSAAGTSVAGTPQASPIATGRRTERRSTTSSRGRDDTVSPTTSAHGVGLGLGLVESTDGTVVGTESVQDTASVASSTAVGAESLSPAGSIPSSPGTSHASVDGAKSAFKTPSLPTAKSWAEVARHG